jgi:serralysin
MLGDTVPGALCDRFNVCVEKKLIAKKLKLTRRPKMLGTNDRDILNGSEGADTIYAYGGDDEIFARGGNDTVYAGDGNDYVSAAEGNDYVLGAAGNDTISGESGDDQIFGMEGDDTLFGDLGNDLMDGGFGNDRYFVDSLGDTVVERISEGDYDRVLVLVDNYTLTANVESLTLLSGSDILKGTGNSLSNGIDGNEFNNVLAGLEGNDVIHSYGGNDRLEGGSGKDFLDGNSGNDILLGGNDDDILWGGAGRDTLTGGSGKDTFYFITPQDGTDKIKDFKVTNDFIGIDPLGFGGGLTMGTLKADQFRVGSSAKDSNDRFIYNKSTGALYFDSDGSGGLAQIQIAKLSTGLAMTNQNIDIFNL